MAKLIVVIMGPGNENFLQMAKDSVKGADKILYFTSISIGRRLPEAAKDIEHHHNYWEESDKQTNGKARNLYLEHLKKNYPDDWCLVIDEDEVVEDINKVKEFIQTAEPMLYSPYMRHFVGDLGHEDATQQQHIVHCRLFKISEAIEYPLESHPVLKGNIVRVCPEVTIWHLGHLPVQYMKYIMKRYNQHANDSIIHSQNFLKGWRNAHLFGNYPTRKLNVLEIPKIILDNFNIDFDELYFTGRDKMEAKHYQDAIDWKEFFEPSQVVCYGCGFGQRVKVLNQIGVPALGWEISNYAVKNALSENVVQGDITKSSYHSYGLAVAYDVLEHISYDNIDQAIKNVVSVADHVLISVPFKGTPNCDLDPTHIIKEDRDWWIKRFTDKGLKLIKTPSYFLYKEQILIFEKVKK